ncbi:MAG TPA: M28 family metallopeptidase [Steroidobacteraceae bacterium]|nr:M28 family metallopeptidase [Steroidobacteraceae bacterium]
MQRHSTRLVLSFVMVAAVAMTACNRARPPAEQAAPANNAPKISAELQQAAAVITADYLRNQISKISSDEFEGRGTASKGDELAMQYLEQQLKTLGYAPGGADGSYRQTFDVVGIKGVLPKTWTFAHGSKKRALKYWDEYIGSSGVQAPTSEIKNAELVFVGYGIQAPEYQWDDFKGMNLKGKVLVMMNNDPDWDPKLFEGTTRLYYGRWTYKYESAARQGAAGAIIIHTTPSAGYPFQVVQSSWSGEQFELPAENEPRIQFQAWATEQATRDLLAMAGQDLDKLIAAAKTREFKPVPLGITTSIKFTNTINRVKTANVLGVLRGSDPVLSKEVVIYSAHHDHLGIGKPDATGDKIYNGAVDNASGVGQVLAIAKAFKALPQTPKRTTMMLFVTAEEQGLLGSKYYSLHPTFPAGKIAANINYDSANIWGKTRDVTFIGKGKSTLDKIVDDFAATQGRKVLPDQMPDRGHYYRSDQFSFAKVGGPAVFLNPGTDFEGKPATWGKDQIEDFEEHRYHQPSDQIDSSWNFDGMIDDARLGFWIGVDIANSAAMPGWNPGDEFDAARKAAIAAAQ